MRALSPGWYWVKIPPDDGSESVPGQLSFAGQDHELALLETDGTWWVVGQRLPVEIPADAIVGARIPFYGEAPAGAV